MLEVDRSQGTALKILKDVGLGVVKSPLVLSAGLGLTLSAFSVSIPGPVNTFLDLLGDAAGPCALFAMGLFLVGQSIRRGAVEVMWVSVLKLIAQPLLTWYIATHLLEMEPHFVAAAVIMAALPTGSLIFVVGERYGIYVQRAAAIILVSTIASVPTVSFVVQYYVSQ
jgi:predicted permease